MGRAFSRDLFRAFVTQRTHVDVHPKMLPGAEQDRPDGQMQLVNQRGAQILTNGGYAAAEANVAAACCSAGLFQSGVNAAGDKPKLRASRHTERRPWIVGQHEHRRVKRGLLAPPAPPAVVGPRTADRTEHVAPKNPGADAGKAALRDAVIDSGLAAVLAVHPAPYACVEKPLHQLKACDAERVLKILVRSGTVTID